MVVFGETVQHLYFADLPRAVSFYTGLLGFSLADSHKPRRGPGFLDAVTVRRGPATIRLYAAIRELAFPKQASFYVSDVDELFAELVAAGVTIDGPPRRKDIDEYGSGQTYGFSLFDPEENPLTFWQEDETAGAVGWPGG